MRSMRSLNCYLLIVQFCFFKENTKLPGAGRLLDQRTHVSVHGYVGGRDLGWHTGAFVVPVPSHSALLLRLSYSPQYSQAKAELQ
jgi:hypothetical protein